MGVFFFGRTWGSGVFGSVHIDGMLGCWTESVSRVQKLQIQWHLFGQLQESSRVSFLIRQRYFGQGYNLGIFRIYEVNHTTCGTCHPECKNSCRGAGADNCTECVNVRDGNFCVAKCPESKYSANGICKPCHDTCIGCTGPENTINANGCKTCHKAIINGDATIERCLGRNEACPGKF